MIHNRFEPPADHYDERLKEIDEEICKLVDQRKTVSNNPGFPTDELITSWAKQYDFHKSFLNGLFGHIFAEEHFVDCIEPKEFVKNIPILQSYTKDKLFYTVTFIRQYENASIVNVTIDCDTFGMEADDSPEHHILAQGLELKVEDPNGMKYSCQNRGGGGFDGHVAFQYIVSPPLPEDLGDVKLIFMNEGNKAKEIAFIIDIEA